MSRCVSRPRSRPPPDASGSWRWFQGGRTNTAWLALDQHVEAGRGGDLVRVVQKTGSSFGILDNLFSLFGSGGEAEAAVELAAKRLGEQHGVVHPLLAEAEAGHEVEAVLDRQPHEARALEQDELGGRGGAVGEEELLRAAREQQDVLAAHDRARERRPARVEAAAAERELAHARQPGYG